MWLSKACSGIAGSETTRYVDGMVDDLVISADMTSWD